jgi:hypothetical protein
MNKMDKRQRRQEEEEEDSLCIRTNSFLYSRRKGERRWKGGVGVG